MKFTAEKLNHWLFGDHKFPTWDGDLSKLLIGVELEFFVHAENDESIIMKKKKYIELNASLFKRGYKQHQSADSPFRVSKDIEYGFVSIMPDYVFHIVEIALPPINNIEDLIRIFQNICKDLDDSLKEIGFQRSKKTNFEVRDFERVHIKRLEGSDDALAKGTSKCGLGSVQVPAYIASTQINTNTLDYGFFKSLPLLYDLEWLAVALFSKKNKFKNVEAKSIRNLMMHETFDDNYLLVNIPKDIPSDEKSYLKAINSCPHYFPNDVMYPVRDLSLIKPKTTGCIEFRSAPVSTDAADLKNIVLFRILQLIYAKEYASKVIEIKDNRQRNLFLKHIKLKEDKSVFNETEKEIINRAIAIIDMLPGDTQEFRKIMEVLDA